LAAAGFESGFGSAPPPRPDRRATGASGDDDREPPEPSFEASCESEAAPAAEVLALARPPPPPPRAPARHRPSAAPSASEATDARFCDRPARTEEPALSGLVRVARGISVGSAAGGGFRERRLQLLTTHAWRRKQRSRELASQLRVPVAFGSDL